MAPTAEIDVGLVGYQVRAGDGTTVLGEVEGVRAHGIRVHKIPGHPRRAGYLPTEAIERIDSATNTIYLTSGVGVDSVVNAPPPPDESVEGWHKSADWWADLLGHYGLFESEGRKSEPFLHPDQR